MTASELTRDGATLTEIEQVHVGDIIAFVFMGICVIQHGRERVSGTVAP
jgi:hypothetical protein